MKYLLLFISFFILSCELERSNPWDPTLPLDKPVTLADSAKCKISTAKTTIAWGDAVMEEKYIVEKQVGTGNWQQVAELAKDSTGYTDNGISYNSAITYRVRSFNPDKDQPYSGYEYFNYYTVSGTITKPDGLPLANAEISGLPYALSTDASGNYCALLPKGWSGSLVVNGYYFDGSIINISSSIVKNATTQIGYTISGNVLSGNTILEGVRMSGFPLTVITNEAGAYITSVPPGWSGEVIPLKETYFFIPASQSYTNITNNQTNQNYSAIIEVHPELVYVESGTFQMGHVSDIYPDGQPIHSVTLSSFYIGKYETTQAEWIKIMGSNPSYYTGNFNLPVEKVSWYDVLVYCNKRSLTEGLTPVYSIRNSTDPAIWGSVPYYIPGGQVNGDTATWNRVICNWSANGYRLPTEAEWEFAGRGGNRSQNYFYSGSNNLNDVAWCTQNAGNTTHPVGTKAANELGIYDMTGNVSELCWDWFGSYSANSQTNPHGASYGTGRTRRGGDIKILDYLTYYYHVAFRGGPRPYIKESTSGFRVVRNNITY